MDHRVKRGDDDSVAGRSLSRTDEAWLTAPHRETENTRDLAAGSLKFEAYLTPIEFKSIG